MQFLAISIMLLFLSVLPSEAMAEAGSSPSNPIIITTAEQLSNIRDGLHKHYRLGCNIALEGDWLSIGCDSAPFTGSLDGFGYRITGLKVVTGSCPFTGVSTDIRKGYLGGLFAASNGTIRDLAVEGSIIIHAPPAWYITCCAGGIVGSNQGIIRNCTFTGDVAVTTNASEGSCAGSISGCNSCNGTISNCRSSGNILADSDTTTTYGGPARAGGIVGYNWDSTVSRCVSYCDVKSISSKSNEHCRSGGIAGESAGDIEYCCYLGGKTFATGEGLLHLGGICGYLTAGTIRNCFASGDIHSIAHIFWGDAGGIAGCTHSSCVIENCYTTASVTAEGFGSCSGGNAGGIMGYGSGTIRNCYATGNITGEYAGGLVGDSYGEIENCFSHADQVINANTVNSGGTSLSDNEMKVQASFTDWNFVNVWAISPNLNHGYPYLRSMPLAIDDGFSATTEGNLDRDTLHLYLVDSEDEQPVPGATVTLGDQTHTTNGNGEVVFSNITESFSSLIISAAGYRLYKERYRIKPGTMDFIFIKQDPGTPYIISADLKNGDQYYSLHRVERIVFDHDTLFIEADWKGKTPGEYQLVAQAGSVVQRIIDLTSGKRSLSSKEGVFAGADINITFRHDDRICVYLADADQTPASAGELDNLHITRVNYDKDLKMGKNIGLTLDEDYPVVGGLKIDFDFDFIPASFHRDPYGGFRLAIGIKDMKNMEENWHDFKNIFEDAKDDLINIKKMRDALAAFGGMRSSMSIMRGWQSEFDIYGYVEGVYENGDPVVTGGVIIKLDFDYENKTQHLVGGIPVYTIVGGGVRMQGKFDDMIFDPLANKMALRDLEGEFKIEPYFSLEGGLGVARVLTVGVQGKAKLKFLIYYNDEDLRVLLEGSAKIKAQALLLSAEKVFLSGSWVIYPHQARHGIEDVVTLNIYDPEEYLLMPREYINHPSEWAGEMHPLRASVRSTKMLRILQTNVYPDAKPLLADLGDRQVLVWIADKINRDSANRTMLVYSVYDATTDTWGEPEAVYDDGKADFSPQIAFNGQNLLVTWHKSKQTFDDTVTLHEMAMAGEIAVSSFDLESNSFMNASILTDNAILDTLPQITIAGGQALVTWISNDQNDLFGLTGLNMISYSSFNGCSWSAPQVLVEAQKPITALSAGFLNDHFVIAYVQDEDNNLETVEDREIYLVGPNHGLVRLTYNESLDSCPRFCSINDASVLFWYNENNIKYITDINDNPLEVFAESKQGLRDDFAVACSQSGKAVVFWTETRNESIELFASLYNEIKEIWSPAIALSDIKGHVQFPDGIFDSAGNIIIAFNNRVTAGNRLEQSDLCIYRVQPSFDLAIENVYFSQHMVAPDTELELEIEVSNRGEFEINEFNVEIFQAGVLNNATLVQQTLRPGDTSTIHGFLNLPEHIVKTDYMVCITPLDGNDSDPGNNSMEITVGYTDLSLKVDRYCVDEKVIVNVVISNNSYIPTDAVLKVTEDSIDGRLLDRIALANISNEANAAYVFKIGINDILFTDDVKILFFSVESVEEELSTGNNSEFVILSRLKETDLPQISIAVHPENAGYINVEASEWDENLLTVTAQPNEGYVFINWTMDGGNVSADPEYTFFAATDCSLVANFLLQGVGDVNGDGHIDVSDAILTLRHIVGLVNLKDKYGADALIRAKVTKGEGEPNVGDVVLILRYIVGLIETFPVELM